MAKSYQEQVDEVRRKRIRAMQRDRARGLTYEQIAVKHGVTAQRVHKILKDAA